MQPSDANTTSLHRLASRIPMATSHLGTPGEIHEMSTDAIAPEERFAFVHAMNLDRLKLSRPPDATGAFELRMRRIFGSQTHLMETTGSPIHVERSRDQALRDGVDYVSLNLVSEGQNFIVEHLGHVHSLCAGMWFIVDSAEPIAMQLRQHVLLTLFLPRFHVIDAVGHIPELMPDAIASGQGIGAVLAAQFRSVAQQAAQMTAAERIAIVGATSSFALNVLQAAIGSQTKDMRAYETIYLGACRLIRERCMDPQLEPAELAREMACSRATLYRAFAAHGEGVSQRIWEVRLTLARNMIESRKYTNLTLGDIAFRCGFLDQPVFNRMFRRRYGFTPGEGRAQLSVQS